MQVKTYQCLVKIPTTPGSKSMTNTQARIQAENSNKAKVMLEAQYGRGNVIGSPTEVKG